MLEGLLVFGRLQRAQVLTSGALGCRDPCGLAGSTCPLCLAWESLPAARWPGWGQAVLLLSADGLCGATELAVTSAGTQRGQSSAGQMLAWLGSLGAPAM